MTEYVKLTLGLDVFDNLNKIEQTTRNSSSYTQFIWAIWTEYNSFLIFKVRLKLSDGWTDMMMVRTIHGAHKIREYFLLFLIVRHDWKAISKALASCFIRVSKHSKTIKALSLHQFSRVWKPWWNTRTRFWNRTLIKTMKRRVLTDWDNFYKQRKCLWAPVKQVNFCFMVRLRFCFLLSPGRSSRSNKPIQWGCEHSEGPGSRWSPQPWTLQNTGGNVCSEWTI